MVYVTITRHEIPARGKYAHNRQVLALPCIWNSLIIKTVNFSEKLLGPSIKGVYVICSAKLSYYVFINLLNCFMIIWLYVNPIQITLVRILRL